MIDVDVKKLKASIADVLPVMKRPNSATIPVLAHALVESDGQTVRFQATDRFIVVNSVFAEGDDLPVFKFLIGVQALSALKSQSAGVRVQLDGGGFYVSAGGAISQRFGPADGGLEWPRIGELMEEAWDDEDYFVPSDETGPAGFNPELVKHIKGAQVIPRINKSAKPSRFSSGGRVRGVIMPVRIPG